MAERASPFEARECGPASTSVVLTCHSEQRWDQLVRAIGSAKQQGPAEVIVVVDHNPVLLDRLRLADPSVTVVPNRLARGASGARNTGALAAATSTIAFLDDDVTASPGWLRNLVAPLTNPAVLGAGGTVVASWLAPKPRWFPDEFGWVVGVSFISRPTDHLPIRNVWGENMAVNLAAFERVGGFREGFGKIGDRSRPEDTDLCIRMRQAAPSGMFVFAADAVVTHDVPAGRSTFRFFLRRCFSEGMGKVEMSRQLGSSGSLGSEHDWLTTEVPRAVRRALFSAARDGRPADAARAAAIVAGIGAAGLGAAIGIARPSAIRTRGRTPRRPKGRPWGRLHASRA